MKNSLSKRRIVLTALIVILAVVFVVQKAVGSRSKVKTLSLQEEITKLELNGFSVEKDGDTWTAGENKYPADYGAVSSLVNAVKSVKLLGNVSTLNASQAERYGFGENSSVTVKAYSGDRLVRTITTGKSTSTNSQSYITVDEKNTIYLAQGALNQTFSVTLDKIRSKEIYDFDSTQIVAVEYNSPEGRYVISKNITSSESGVMGQPVWTIVENTTSAKNVQLSEEKLDSFVQGISSLDCSEWLSDTDRFDYAEYTELVIRTPASSVTVKIVSDGDDFIGTASTTPYLFKITGYAGSKFIKNLLDLRQ